MTAATLVRAPERCAVKGCPFCGPQCPDHGRKYPRGFVELNRLIRQRPGDTTRGGGRRV